MTANSTISSIGYVFKHVYDTGLYDEGIRLHPTIEDIQKIADFGGDQINYSVKMNNAQNITSGALSLAQGVGSSSKGVQFAMKRIVKRATISVDVEALEAAKIQPDGAFATLVTNEVDGLVSEMLDRLGFDIFRDSTGNRGQISAINGNTVTFANPDDARNWKIGMVGSAAQNSDGTSPRTGSSPVTNLDWDAGTVTFLSVASIVSLSTNDFMFASPEVGNNIEGFELCTPLTAPASSDSFRGQNRSQNTVLLSGSRINDTGTPIEENAGKVAVKIRQAGGRADRLTLNPQRYWEMCRRLGAKVMYQGAGGTAEYGFEQIIISTPAGPLKCISDPDCPTTRGRVYNSKSHRIRTLKDFIHMADEDGMYSLRLTTDDAIEFRCRHMGNYQQTAPRDHGVFAI